MNYKYIKIPVKFRGVVNVCVPDNIDHTTQYTQEVSGCWEINI